VRDRLRSKQRGRKGSPASVTTTPRAPLAAALAVALVGLAVALWLVRLHFRAHAGLASFCAFDEVFNCDRVATSRYAVFLGLPVAAWGVLGFAVSAGLAGLGLARNRPHRGWPAGLVLLVAAAAVAASVVLALVSELLIGAFCLLCAGAWALSLLLLVAAWRACQPGGAAAAVRSDVAVLRRNLPRTAVVAAALGAVLVVALVAYPRYWSKPAHTVGTAGATGAGSQRPPVPARSVGAVPATTPQAGDSSEILVFSDYACPFCAKAHEDTEAALSRNPALRVVHRHFPLDPECNPLVKRPVHPGACALARAAICAEPQGKEREMSTALFRNQEARRPVESLAAELGLDLALFRTCIVAPETAQRLAADVAEGIGRGIKVTPSFVVGGAIHPGQLPPALTSGGEAASAR
jgi:protein-disulfide isomerase